jgi:hypothetical protein
MSVIASVACLLVALAGSAEASPPVAQLTDRTPIAAYGDHLVWSQRDAKTGEFQLIDEVAGSTHILPVRERAVPFDVDLGPDARGTPVAVYSRCRRELWESRDANSGLIAYGAPTARNAGCDLYRLDLTSGRERPLARLNRAGSSETLPTIWGNTIAFVRVYSHRPRVAGALAHLLYTRGAGRIHEIRGGTRGIYDFHGYLNGTPVVEGGPGPLQLDLRSNVLAFSWNSLHNRCNHTTDDRISPLVQEIWRVRLSQARRRVAHACDVGSGNGVAGVYGASLGPAGLSYFASFPTRTPAWGLNTWSGTCALQSEAIETDGIPIAMTTTNTDRYLLINTADASYEITKSPLGASQPCPSP